MDTGQATGESATGGGPSIAEELLRAIMENPASTADKVTAIYYLTTGVQLSRITFCCCPLSNTKDA